MLYIGLCYIGVQCGRKARVCHNSSLCVHQWSESRPLHHRSARARRAEPRRPISRTEIGARLRARESCAFSFRSNDDRTRSGEHRPCAQPGECQCTISNVSPIRRRIRRVLPRQARRRRSENERIGDWTVAEERRKFLRVMYNRGWSWRATAEPLPLPDLREVLSREEIDRHLVDCLEYESESFELRTSWQRGVIIHVQAGASHHRDSSRLLNRHLGQYSSYVGSFSASSDRNWINS
ncbi:unnamed protein product [Trichogramma brassicae]|uniref:Uncharacterized protein n=1 Tax=Trichogramma brassicae TaxID=86971 RepID=A0A6H5HYR0_9HYME|nr:unnamed protein product [Trichogramma brassicae]